MAIAVARALSEIGRYLVLVPVKLGIVEANRGRNMSFPGDVDDRYTISMPPSGGSTSADQCLKTKWPKKSLTIGRPCSIPLLLAEHPSSKIAFDVVSLSALRDNMFRDDLTPLLLCQYTWRSVLRNDS